MIKKTIKYTDYNGVERTEDFYFNLSKAELAEMEVSVKGGFVEMVKSLYNLKDIPAIAAIFKDLLLRSYGRKSVDGRRFIKEENGVRLSDEFKETEAYSVLYMELISDTDAAIAFINGLPPADIAAAAAAEAEKAGGVENLVKLS
jgi:hypothetical protein